MSRKVSQAELDSLEDFCRKAAGESEGLWVKCGSGSVARQLQRRYHHLRGRLAPGIAEGLQAKVIGRFFILSRSPSPVDFKA